MSIGSDDAALVASVKTHEGWRAHPYICSGGAVTIGWGHNCDAVPPPPEVFRAWERRGLRIDEGEALLADDLARAIDDAHRYPWFAGLPQPAQRVIVEMIFQLGAGGFAGFRRAIAAFARHDYAAAADEMRDSQWHRHDTPTRAETLARRVEGLAPTTGGTHNGA